MRRSVFLAFLLVVTPALAADFNTESNASFTLGDTAAGEVHNSFSTLLDHSLDEHWHFVWGAEFERYDFNKSTPVLPEVLQSLGAHLSLEYREKDDPVFMLEIQPGWHGGKDFTDGAFDSPVTLASGYPVTQHVDLALGVYYSHLARYEWLPVGGVVWKPAKDVEVDLLFPNTTLNWSITDKDTLVVFLEELGSGYRVNDASGTSVDVEYYQTRTGLQWEHEFAPGWSSSLQAGWALGRTMDFYNQDRTVTSPTVPFLALGLKARF